MDFQDILDDFKDNDETKTIASEASTNNYSNQLDEQQEVSEGERAKPFDTKEFANELKRKSEEKNKKFAAYSENINAYGIAQECISAVVKKILNYPVESYADKWLPLVMRSTIGTAIHDVIQNNTSQFTETEASIKVPSIRFSGRLDGIIGNNVLVEIKSCPYKDYEWIVKNQQPRKSDFYQLMIYKYIIENYIDEIKSHDKKLRTPAPKLNNYNIDTLQFIYVAHDICAADVETLDEALNSVKNVKKILNSKSNDFFFITSAILDVNCFDPTPYIKYIKSKIDNINYYINHNKLPTKDDPFVDKKKCFFCLYQSTCEL